MSLYILLASLIVVVNSAATSGITLAIGSKFFKNERKTLSEKIASAIRNIDFASHLNTDYYQLTTKASIKTSDQALNIIGLDENSFDLFFNSNSTIGAKVKGFSINYEVAAKSEGLSELIRFDGKFKLAFNNINIDISTRPVQTEGVLGFEDSIAYVTMEDSVVDVQGEGLLLELFNVTVQNFKDFIQKEITNSIAQSGLDSLQGRFNEVFEIGQNYKVVEGSSVFLNATMMADPVITADYVSLPINGSFFSPRF